MPRMKQGGMTSNSPHCLHCGMNRGEGLVIPSISGEMMQQSGGGDSSTACLSDSLKQNNPLPVTDVREEATSSRSEPPPVDKYKVVYLIMVLHGMGTLMSWNMFINAKDYFENYKLGNSAQNGRADSTWYSSHFMPGLSWTSQLPSVGFSWINLFFPCGGSVKRRIVVNLVIESLICFLTLGLAMVDTTDSVAPFFWLTMFCVGTMNTANGLYQNSIYGVASKLGYVPALVLGSNISGVFTSLVQLFILSTELNPLPSALFYFSVSTVVMLLCLGSYLRLPSFPFYNHYEIPHGVDDPVTDNSFSHLVYVLKMCYKQCFNIFMVFFVTLIVFPAIYSNIKVLDPHFIIADSRYFLEVTCFVTFNVSSLLGNLCAEKFPWPNPQKLWIPVTLRVLFIPFFLTCNYQPIGISWTRNSVFFGDYAYWIGGAMLGFTNGHFSCLAMTYCPRGLEGENARVAGMFGAAFLVTGVFVGLSCSYFMPYLVSL